jgi:hypothetical protein
MILLADPHPFIVQDTYNSSDAEIRAKSQTSAQLRGATHKRLTQVVFDRRSRDFSADSVTLMICGIV